MASENAPDKPVWEGFVLLGLRLTRSLVEIADVQTRRIEQRVRTGAENFYARRESDDTPRRQAIHRISAMFDEVVDRLRREERD